MKPLTAVLVELTLSSADSIFPEGNIYLVEPKQVSLKRSHKIAIVLQINGNSSVCSKMVKANNEKTSKAILFHDVIMAILYNA